MQKSRLYKAILLVNRGADEKGRELRDEARFAKTPYEQEKRMLDEVQVYQHALAVEESRRLEGKAPKVRFLSSEEQQTWKRQYPQPTLDVGNEAQHRQGGQR